MAKLLTSIFFFFLSFSFFRVLAQDTTKTQQNKKTKEGYKHWTNYQTSIRFGLGAQKSFYSEIGISRLRYFYNDLGYAATAYYAALEWTPTFLPNKFKNIYGAKVGYQLNMRALALGIESKFQTDGSKNNFLLTPKVGLGFLGVVNFFYGYNISFSCNPFVDTGHNQFSIVTNLNRQVLRRQKK